MELASREFTVSNERGKAAVGVMEDRDARSTAIDEHLHQVDSDMAAPRRPELARGAPQTSELLTGRAPPGPPLPDGLTLTARQLAKGDSPGLHLDTHELLCATDDQVDLRRSSVQPPRQDSPAATAEVALREPLSDLAELLGRERARAQRHARRDSEQEPKRELPTPPSSSGPAGARALGELRESPARASPR